MTQVELELDTQYIKRLEARIAELETQIEDMKYHISEEYITSLEARIAELTIRATVYQDIIAELEAPKSCEGCKYEIFYELDNCTNCSRAIFLIDKYEPKDS